MSATLRINEIFLSLQGESTFAGLPCVFVRLTGCNLRCSFCDSAYAFSEGETVSLAEVLDKVNKLAEPFAKHTSARRLPLVEVTGGEPLLQEGSLALMTALCDQGYTVLLETNGAMDISPVDGRAHRIMDLKCPSSGESGRNRIENLVCLKETDEIKFVIGTREDYDWAVGMMERHRLARICPVLFSWVSPLRSSQHEPSLRPIPAGQTPILLRELAERIIADGVPARFQLQMHKLIWPPDQRGV